MMKLAARAGVGPRLQPLALRVDGREHDERSLLERDQLGEQPQREVSEADVAKAALSSDTTIITRFTPEQAIELPHIDDLELAVGVVHVDQTRELTRLTVSGAAHRDARLVDRAAFDEHLVLNVGRQ